MQNNEYLSEEKYQKNNAKVKTIGKVLLIVGILVFVLGVVLTIIGSTGFRKSTPSTFNPFDFDTVNNFDVVTNTADSSFGSFELFGLGAFIIVFGFSLLGAGLIVMFISHRREITAYTTQQVMPVAQEGIEKMTPAVADAAGSIAKSVSKGIQEGKKEADDNK